MSWVVDGSESCFLFFFFFVFWITVDITQDEGLIWNALGECAVSGHVVIRRWILYTIPAKWAPRKEAVDIAFDGKWDEMCEGEIEIGKEGQVPVMIVDDGMHSE